MRLYKTVASKISAYTVWTPWESESDGMLDEKEMERQTRSEGRDAEM